MALCATGTAEETALCDLSSTDGAQIIRIGCPPKAAAMGQKSRQNGGYVCACTMDSSHTK